MNLRINDLLWWLAFAALGAIICFELVDVYHDGLF